MSSAQEYLNQVEATHEAKPKSKKAKSSESLESSLAIAADTQYANGAAMVERIAQQSFYRGVEDAVSNLLEASDLGEEQLEAIAAKFQNAASKRLQSTQNLILPASAWLEGDDE
jgi:hypothetical protein